MPKLLKAIVALSALSITALIAGCGATMETTKLTATSETKNKPAIIDNGEKGSSGGDITAFQSELAIEGSNETGSVEGVVTVVPSGGGEGAERRLGLVQFSLPKGTIITSGIYAVDTPRDRQPSKEGVTRAIIGGTGDYSSAGGEVVSTPVGEGKIQFKFNIELVS